MKPKVLFLTLLLFFISSIGGHAFEDPARKSIPDVLKQWIPWVMYGHEEIACPGQYNDAGERRCVWEAVLELDLDGNGGVFSMKLLAFTDSWVVLPGETGIWPEEVEIDSVPVPVLPKKIVPRVYVTRGTHTVNGVFRWSKLPDVLQIPQETGVVKLRVNGSDIERPLISRDGKLWLKKEKTLTFAALKVHKKAFRLIDDTIPMTVTTLVMLDISGQPQELVLKKVLLPRSVPMEIQTELPAEIRNGGDIAIQARQGRWKIRIKSRMKGPVKSIVVTNAVGGREIWAFKAENDLRMVKLQGVVFIDPRQTDMPGEWRRFTSFVVKPGMTITFKEIKRGDPDPPPDVLKISKTFWLDFNGRGYTVQDIISGKISRSWHLVVNPPQVLGRVSVDGKDRLITSFGKKKRAGVELRRGTLNLVAESRIEKPLRTLPAVGWMHDFQSVSGTLNLPPGWKLVAVQGADEVTGTWIEKWTLLDFFVVLIISLSVLKLKGWKWFLVALFALCITYHEPAAPRLVWLHVIASLAILSYVSIPWIRKASTLWYWASMIVLLVITIPFIVQQVRVGVYPQLEHPNYQGTQPPWNEPGRRMVKPVRKSYHPPGRRIRTALSGPESQERYLYGKSAGLHEKKQAVMVYDTSAMIQTGPGLPLWKWNTVSMKWNGPVRSSQTIRLWLLSPVDNLVLSMLRVILIILLITALARKAVLKVSGNFLPLLLALCVLLPVSPGLAAGESPCVFPPADMLKELQGRLLKEPECAPVCANVPKAVFSLDHSTVKVFFKVDAGTLTSIPLPQSTQWFPREVFVDSKPAKGIARDTTGIFWVVVSKGIHTVIAVGKVPSEDVFQFSFPLRPLKVVVESKDWKVEGVSKEGKVGASILFTRESSSARKPRRAAGTHVPPFFEVERTLSLALDWQVKTRVRRLTPPVSSAFVSIPLLPGESVMKSGVRVKNGKVLVSMEPGQTETEWFSALKKVPLIKLKAPTSVPWVEKWKLDASPIWHCDLKGIPVIHHRNKSGFWMPQWRPWPGESVEIAVTRLRGIPGRRLTIEKSDLRIVPGTRFSKSELYMKLRSTKGEHHEIYLPRGSKLIEVTINGRSQPIKLKADKLILPLSPGLQTCRIAWYDDTGLSTVTRSAPVNLGTGAVNANVYVKMPRSRWILWTGGPSFGPAVLFWSYLVVVLIAAIILGKYTKTPLGMVSWFLLGIGLTQIAPVMAIAVVGWLILLSVREKNPLGDRSFLFNCLQLLVFFATLVALWCLYVAVKNGLLGIPDMQITGNGSTNYWLHWTQDRVASNMPAVWTLSLPLYVFRFLMLFWALWLAYSLLGWLRWGWECFGTGGFWKKIKIRRKKTPQPPPVPTLEKIE